MLRKISASIADQATFSGISFAVNILLARWLAPADYGAFSVAWSAAFILAAFHSALILEPMTIIGPAEFSASYRTYFKSLTRLNWFAVAILGCLTAAASFLYREPASRSALLAMGVTLPAYLLLLTSRREQYVLRQPARALHLSLCYALSLFALLNVLKFTDLLTPARAVLASAAISLPVTLWALTRRNLPTDEIPNSKNVAAKHWLYGKWLVAAAILGVGVSDLQILLLSKLVSLDAAGTLRALMNFVLPLTQLLTTLGVYALPKLARTTKARGLAQSLRQNLAYSVVIALLTLCYAAALLRFGPTLEHFLYRAHVNTLTASFSLLAVVALFSGMAAALTTPLRAAQNSRHIFHAGLAATITGLFSALILLPRYAVHGALISLTLANAASALVMAVTYLRLLRQTKAAQAAAPTSLVIFDENLIPTSPVGSCILRIVEDNAPRYPMHLFYNRLEPTHAVPAALTRLPLPAGPVVLRSVLFTAFAAATYWFRLGGRPTLRLAAQGVFPFCQIGYAHFCHRIFLRDHRDSIGGSPLRRIARYMIHYWGAWSERLAFRNAQIIVVPSNGLARELTEAYPRETQNKLITIANPVDTTHYQKPVTFPKLQSDTLSLCFCALGNFERKGLSLILEAMAQIKDVKLTVVGGKESEIREYQSRAQNLNVEFTGLQSDIRPYLWSADAFIFPSIYEAFPLVSLQAAAAGLPLITTAVNGIEEFMTNEVTGWIVPRNTTAIAQAIMKAQTHREALPVMGEAARQRVTAYGEAEFRTQWQSLLTKLHTDHVKPVAI